MESLLRFFKAKKNFFIGALILLMIGLSMFESWKVITVPLSIYALAFVGLLCMHYIEITITTSLQWTGVFNFMWSYKYYFLGGAIFLLLFFFWLGMQMLYMFFLFTLVFIILLIVGHIKVYYGLTEEEQSADASVGRTELTEVIKKSEWDTLNTVIMEETGYVLVPSEKWEIIQTELQARLKEGEEWDDVWSL